MPQVPLAAGAQPGHDRRPSGESGMGAPGRGGFTPGGRGRGYSNHNQYQQGNHMGYQGNNNGQFRGGLQQGRGGMPGQFQGQGRPMQPYGTSPHQGPARSPALTNSVPTTPNMGQAMPMPAQHYGGYQQQYMGAPQVYNPSTTASSLNFTKPGGGKSKKKKNGQNNGVQAPVTEYRPPGHTFKLASGELPSAFVPHQQLYQIPENSQRRSSLANVPAFPPVPPFLPVDAQKIDLSPESGNFEQVEQMLTNRKQNYGYPGMQQPYDRMTGMPMMGYPMQGYNPAAQFMPGMAPQSPQPGFQQPFVPGQYGGVPQPQAMSRSSSQISERPASALGPQTPSAAPSVPAAKPAAPAYVRPARKSAALVIKNADGEVVQLPSVKAAPSPAPSAQTPPVVVSTPTPPPKSVTPQQNRPESKASTNVAKEFQEKVRLAAEQEAAKEKSEAPKAAEAKPVEAKVEAKVEEPKAEEKKIEEKPAEKAEEKKDTSEADAAAAAAKAKQEEEDEFERQIAEMEAAEAEREKKEQELLEKRKAAKAKADTEAAEKNKLSAAENDAKLREQEREMERIEDERAAKRAAAEAGTSEKKADSPLTPSSLATKVAAMKIGDGASSPASDDSMGPPPKPSAVRKPAALNLTSLNTKSVEPAQPSAALQSLKSARFLSAIDPSIYPEGIQSPNPALNTAVASKGKSFKYDKEFLMQFQKVFTEKPSVEFEAQIKALIGDGSESRQGSRIGSNMGARQASKGGAMGAMGSFNPGKTLPPGTTSAQRFAMANAAIPRPGNPMTGDFRSTSSFGGGMSGGRNASMGSPRNANQSRGGARQGSKRGGESKPSQEAEKKMPLTAGMVLKPIEVTASGWKPRSVMAQASATGTAGPAPGGAPGQHMDPEMVQRKVKAALNKMTPEKFDKIADQILDIAAQSKQEADGRTLRQVIQLTFEKATDEAHWASMYAKFCKRMLETMSPDIKDESIVDKNGNVVSGGNLFRKYLLNRCQEEFERGWKMDLPEKPEGEKGDEKTGEAAMLSDEYYIAEAAKRRGLGLVQFIGELYKLGMLTERIMHECVKKLVDYTGIPDEAEIESLTKLLRTIGANLDNTEKGRPMMDVYFSRIEAMMETPELPSRLKFMLMDIVDLRKKRWVSKEANKGPKTLDEIRAEVRTRSTQFTIDQSLTCIQAEAAAAQKAAENARGPRGGGGGGGRMQMGRGDGRQFSNYGNQPPVDYTKNTVATDDLRRLGNKAAARNTGGPMSFAPTSMFSSRSNSNRKMGPGGSLMGGREGSNSSRSGTPPQQKEKESVAVANAFDLLKDLEDHHEPEHPASPPSVASPELTKSPLANEEKKEE